MGLLIRSLLKEKKIINVTKKQQATFLRLLSDLLNNGFTIQESLRFMDNSKIISKNIILFLRHTMEQGESFDRTLAFLGFDSLTITQIELAQKHGNLPETLKKIEKHMALMVKQRQNFFKVMSYPILLILFVLTILISIRQILLPQLLLNNMVQKENIGIQFIQKGPLWLFLLCNLFFVIFLLIKKILDRKNSLDRAYFLTKIPILGSFYSIYYSAFFALEWGKLFSQGLEIKTVIQLMSKSNELSLMREVAKSIEKRSMKGQLFHKQLKKFPFFVPELASIIEQGEIKGNLGKELIIYSEICFQRFFSKIEKTIQWIQPLIFLIVAVLIVSVYAAMLLPIYGGVDNFL